MVRRMLESDLFFLSLSLRPCLQKKAEKSSGALWLVGLALGMLACICNAFGMVYQRKAHEDDNCCLTYIGVGAVFMAGLLDFAAFGFAAQTVIAPVRNLTKSDLLIDLAAAVNLRMARIVYEKNSGP